MSTESPAVSSTAIAVTESTTGAYVNGTIVEFSYIIVLLCQINRLDILVKGLLRVMEIALHKHPGIYYVDGICTGWLYEENVFI